MPAIDEKTALAIAKLARLDLREGLAPGTEEAELKKLVEEFGKIVGYMDILGEVDTEGVEPLYSPMVEPRPPREDAPFTAAAKDADARGAKGAPGKPESSGDPDASFDPDDPDSSAKEDRARWILDDAPMTFGRYFTVPKVV
ncbi:MAG: aspartyl/glutamyl-tRNA amidotransferase subunit C [Deltaproteobacteria bacterium]|jgi:aspartyl-tRNA(Asn)/glutamyl-tRNA(Gln) amidotransferase subunit C|nr:aspartyl/glutamyl-tRNA amidotransferase subunit C [Deltaproteobacteria bacterium]